MISYFDLKRRRRDFVREKFGRMPKIREWNDTVRNYYDVVNDGTGIDSVTWNDLSLNGLFGRRGDPVLASAPEPDVCR